MRKLIGLLLVSLFLGSNLIGPAAAQSKKAMTLIQDLADKSPKVRASAAVELGDLADVKLADAQSAMPKLKELLKDTDGEVRKAVIEALAKIEPDFKDQMALLQSALKDKDSLVQLAGINGFARLGQQMQDARPTLQKEALPTLQEVYKASFDSKTAPKTAKAPPPPQPNMVDASPAGVRRSILNAVNQIQPDAKMRVPFLIEALKPEKDVGVRLQIVNILGQVGPLAKAALPVLLETQKASLQETAKSKDLDPQGLRRSILVTIGSIEPEPKEYVPILTDALKNDKDLGVRVTAAQALGRVGPPAKDALPALLAAHKSAMAATDPQGLRKAILEAVTKIQTDPKELVTLLIDFLKRERDLGVRLTVVTALGEIGPPAKSALPALLDAMKASPPIPKALDPQGVRKAILETIGKLQPEPKEYVPILIDAMKKDRDTAVRTVAIQGLAQLGPVAKEAVPALTELQKTKLTRDDDKALAKEAEAALQKIQSK